MYDQPDDNLCDEEEMVEGEESEDEDAEEEPSLPMPERKASSNYLSFIHLNALGTTEK